MNTSIWSFWYFCICLHSFPHDQIICECLGNQWAKWKTIYHRSSHWLTNKKEMFLALFYLQTWFLQTWKFGIIIAFMRKWYHNVSNFDFVNNLLNMKNEKFTFSHFQQNVERNGNIIWSKNLKIYTVSSTLIIPPHLWNLVRSQWLWVGDLFENTMHVWVFLVCYSKNLTPCCDGTFLMLNVFIIRRTFKQYILCIG